MIKKLSQLFVHGLLVILPIVATGAFIYWLFNSAENLFRPPLQLFLPDDWYIKGMGVVSALLFTLLIGALFNVYFFKLLFKWFEKLLNKLPLVKQVYSSIRDLMSFMGDSDKKELQKVVMLDFSGFKLIGFVTAEDTALGGKESKNNDEKMLSVYLPMSYQMGGYLVYVPESKCETIDMPVSQAMQTILTANITSGETKE